MCVRPRPLAQFYLFKFTSPVGWIASADEVSNRIKPAVDSINRQIQMANLSKEQKVNLTKRAAQDLNDKDTLSKYKRLLYLEGFQNLLHVDFASRPTKDDVDSFLEAYRKYTGVARDPRRPERAMSDLKSRYDDAENKINNLANDVLAKASRPGP